MYKLDFIKTVKIQGQGYLLNGTMCVPKADGNSEYELVKQWMSEGNIPEPEFTEEELVQQEINMQINKYKQYLDSTDFKMTVDYYATLTEAEQIELTQKRLEAREFIRANEVTE